ncbi:hypothetical protein [Thiomonas sp.]
MSPAASETSMRSSIDRHRSSPDVSLDEHVRRCQIVLAQALEPRQAIYLDTKFWIILRDAATGVRATEDKLELLALLRANVAVGKAFCPISESTFAELFKQPD